jgi:hypothetical protein
MTLGPRGVVPPEVHPQTDSRQSTNLRAFPHQPVPHELRNAWLTAKQLEERLEVANQPELRRVARWIRDETFLELMRFEGYAQIDLEEVMPDPA